MSPSIEVQTREEIEALHEFFVEWFSGRLARSAFEQQFLPRFAEALVFVPPSGTRLGLRDLASSVEQGHASNPDFRIAIRNVRVHLDLPGHVLATYEEWQRNARASTPPDNGRVATVVFEKGDRLRWLHIHETWVPPGRMAAGPYDF